MPHQNHRLTLHQATLTAFLLTCLSCGSSGGSSGAGVSQSYQGPGSTYTVDLEADGSFAVTIAPDPVSAPTTTVGGSYERLASGFLRLVVTSASGVDAPNPGDEGIALEIPGFAFLLKPLDSDGEIIPMVLAGQCPAEDMMANWFITSCNESGSACDATDTDKDFLGAFSYDAASGIANLPAAYSIASGAPMLTNPLGSAACSDGIMEVDDARMYLTPVGGAIVHTGADDPAESKHILALPKEAIVPATLEGSYAGLVFDNSDDAVFAVNVVVASGGGSASIFEVDENALDQATSGAQIATLTFTSTNDVSGSAEDGWLTGTLDNGVEPARPVYCMASTDLVGSGRNMVMCVGQSPGDASAHYNAVFVSKG